MNKKFEDYLKEGRKKCGNAQCCIEEGASFAIEQMFNAHADKLVELESRIEFIMENGKVAEKERVGGSDENPIYKAREEALQDLFNKQQP